MIQEGKIPKEESVMKIWKIVLLAIAIIVGWYATLLLIPKKRMRYMSDHELRTYALSHGLSPIPKEYYELLRILDTSENPISWEKIELGRELFFDPILSKNMSISCHHCHKLSEGGDDNLPTAIGIHGLPNPKHLNSPTVLNAALAKRQFWDGRAKDVEEQAGGPMQAPFEMGITPKLAVERIGKISHYREKFLDIFGDVSFENIRKAIGAYERTLLTRGAFDRFLEGDDHAIDAAAKRGLNLFIQKGCKGCHTGMSVGGQSMQHFPLRRWPADLFKSGPFPFPDTGGFLGKNDQKLFRVPILRNITETAPYFHNGSVKDLKEAIRIMSKYQIGEEFTPAQIDDVVAFFKTLKGEIVDYRIHEKP